MDRLFTRKFLWPFLKDFLSVLGVEEIFVAIVGFFDVLKPISDFFKASHLGTFLVFLGAAAIWAVVRNWPRNEFEYRVNGRDIRMRLVIGDIFKQEGSLVVPINSEFDAFLGGSVAKSNSVKAQVISRYFGGDKEILSEKLKKQLKRDIYKVSRVGTTYAMGTTVSVEQNDHKFYFAVNSVKTNHQRVEARKEDLVPALSGLWAYLVDHGSKGDVVVPLLGTGNGRLSMPREDVFKEIVRSFIASCSEKSYCDRLTIVIKPNDIKKWEINIDMLAEFLLFQCRYATFDNRQGRPTGNPVPLPTII
jgi:hypothetical protein